MNSKDVNLSNENESFNGRALYIKTQNVIKHAKIQKYAKESDFVYAGGVTFFGGLTGENELKLERLRNIKLKMELVQAQKIDYKETYELQDMMSDLYACAISELGGNFTSEMRNMYDKMKNEYGKNQISEEKVYELACEKIVGEKSFLPIIHKESVKGIFGDTKVQIAFYKIENQKLENQIVAERGKSQFDTFSYAPNNPKVIIPKPVGKNIKNA